ncbi:hypothetical protein T484DRAFT_1876635, partial [Baffinella frigidus]
MFPCEIAGPGGAAELRSSYAIGSENVPFPEEEEFPEEDGNDGNVPFPEVNGNVPFPDVAGNSYVPFPEVEEDPSAGAEGGAEGEDESTSEESESESSSGSDGGGWGLNVLPPEDPSAPMPNRSPVIPPSPLFRCKVDGFVLPEDPSAAMP